MEMAIAAQEEAQVAARERADEKWRHDLAGLFEAGKKTGRRGFIFFSDLRGIWDSRTVFVTKWE